MRIIKKIKNKILSIKREYYQKRHFFNPVDAAFYAVSPYLGRYGAARHRAILQFLKSDLKNTLTKYADVKTDGLGVISDSCPIWFMWWQGKNAMPPIVRACYASVEKHKGCHPLVFLDRNNYADYVKLPPPLLTKMIYNNWIAALSDVIRFGLLSVHGGIWLDSTLLVTRDINNFSTSLYSIRHRKGNPRFVLNGDKWSVFMFAAIHHHPAILFIYDALLEYFMKHDYLIDYHLTDYVIATMYLENRSLRRHIDCLPLDNPECLALLLKRDFPYDEKKWRQIAEKNCFNKLDWRIPVNKGTMLESVLLNG